jgi:large subunit ribosomal protein L15
MALSLSNIKRAHGSTRGKKRVGRGLGSKGTTAGRGQKGQTSRAGSHGTLRVGLRHLMLQTPKLRGFTSLAKKPAVVNLDDLAETFMAGEVVSPETLLKKGMIDSKDQGVKILGRGEISLPLSIKNCKVSASVAEKIVKAGGKVE